jgi:glucose-6-phosphate 1-dehydrogenase
MAANQIDALVIFGATGDLAKLETFPALAGLVERGVLPDQDTWRDPAG